MAEAKRWSDFREVGFLSGMRFLLWTYRMGGFLAFWVVLQPVLLYYFLTNRRARNASLEYLRTLKTHFPTGNLPKPGLWSSYRHFNAFATSSMDRLAVWTNGSILNRIRFPNRPILLRQLASGRGAILLGAHLGNMEICRGLSTRNPDLKLNILVHTRNADMFNRMLQDVVGESSITLIEVSELSPATAIRLQECIARGEFIAILADRVPVEGNSRHTKTSFLGRPASFPDGPFILAALLKCPVYTLFCTRSGKDYDIHCEEFADEIKLPRASRKEALAHYVDSYARTLEDRVKNNPLQWFNFYPFWDQA